MADDHHEESEGVYTKMKAYMPGKVAVTRFAYMMFLLFGFVLAILFRDGFFGAFNKTQSLIDFCDMIEDKYGWACKGVNMVYRISFSLVIFYLLHVFLCSRLFFVGDKVRLALNYHWLPWLFRIPFAILLFVGFYFIPNVFYFYYSWVALGLSAFFLLAQVILLIDGTYEWFENWRAKCPEDQQYSKWDILMLIFSIFFYILSIVFVVLCFVFFGSGPTCHLQRFFICFQIVLGVLVSALSFLFKKGFLVSSVTTLFATFCVWSALLSDPDTKCNRLWDPSSNAPVAIITMILGLVVSAISLMRAAFSTSEAFTKLFSLSDDSVHPESAPLASNAFDEDEKIKLERKECSELWDTQVVFMLASAYLAMVIGNWNAGYREGYVDEGPTAMWVKMVTSWFVNIIFIWTLAAPLILGRCRKFRNHDE